MPWGTWLNGWSCCWGRSAAAYQEQLEARGRGPHQRELLDDPALAQAAGANRPRGRAARAADTPARHRVPAGAGMEHPAEAPTLSAMRQGVAVRDRAAWDAEKARRGHG